MWPSAFLIVAALVSAVLGALTVRRSIKLATGLGIGFLVLILSKAVLFYFPLVEPRLFPWDGYPFVEPWILVLPTTFLIGAGLYAARASRWRRDLILILGGLFLACTGWQAWSTRGDHERLQGYVAPDGVCFQTSGYSCVAAAAAMLLHRYGVPATEREMARICVTGAGPLGGTTDCGTMRGLRRKLPGRAVRIAAPRYEEIPAPCLVAVRLNALVCHCVMVEEVRPEEVSLIDPLKGRRIVKRADFERDWRGTAIYVEPEKENPRP